MGLHLAGLVIQAVQDGQHLVRPRAVPFQAAFLHQQGAEWVAFAIRHQQADMNCGGVFHLDPLAPRFASTPGPPRVWNLQEDTGLAQHIGVVIGDPGAHPPVSDQESPGADGGIQVVPTAKMLFRSAGELAAFLGSGAGLGKSAEASGRAPGFRCGSPECR